MSLIINNNISSLVAQRGMQRNTMNITKTIERLSTGLRINHANDDAAGLSISEGLRGQIRGNNQALNNVQDGINMLQVAEGGFNVINDSVQRIRELCVQALNETYGSTERQAILEEINARIADIDRIASSTQFNKIPLLDGSVSVNARLQVGPNSGVTVNTIDIAPVLTNVKSSALGSIGIGLSLTGQALTGGNWATSMIRTYLDRLDEAVYDIASKRSAIGAIQNRLEGAVQNLQIMNENLTHAESRIRDLDIAKASAELTKAQILQQASASVLSQANQIPQLALSLLR